jgi:glyoxylase-like metal-dependent hydrolase (beta-lactamase superfamily II)
MAGLRLARRQLLQAGMWGAAAAALGIPVSRRAYAQAPEGVRVEDLGGDLYVLAVGGVNAVALSNVDGVALVDGGSAATSPALLGAVGKLPASGTVHTLFNTHWHPEQTGSNERLGTAKATIVAQENTRLWLSTDVTWPWDETRTFQPLPEVARPTKTTYDRDRIRVGSKTLEYGHLRHAAHTDGDLYVLFPEANVLAVGDSVTSAGWQTIDWWTGGWIGGVVGNLELLLAMAGPATRVVPARGPVMSRQDLEAQFAMYSTIYERLSRLLNSGRSPQEAVESKATVEFDEKMGDSAEFVTRAFESMWAYLAPDA